MDQVAPASNVATVDARPGVAEQNSEMLTTASRVGELKGNELRDGPLGNSTPRNQ